MLDSQGFDLWAGHYDQTVQLSDQADEYPFAGYKDVLGTIYRRVREGNGRKVLDVGFGTGVLTRKLYDDGCAVYGLDFSQEMIDRAGEKMPRAVLLRHDFTRGLPREFRDEKFDFILSTYAIHHLDYPQQTAFLRELLGHLTEGGRVLIGDVAFATRAELTQCQAESGDEWDDEEYYPVAEDLRAEFPQVEFTKISFCAGVLSFGAGDRPQE